MTTIWFFKHTFMNPPINCKSADYKAGYKDGASNERKAIKDMIACLSPSLTRDGFLTFISSRIKRMKRRKGGII